jgi:hypothetical protein
MRGEWNALVPTAQAFGIRGVHEWSQTSAYRLDRVQNRLDWLRAQLEARGWQGSASLTPPPTATATVALNGALEPHLADKTFGVEIECIFPRGLSRSQLAEKLTQAGIQTTVETWNHTTRTWWKITTDSSLNHDRGYEIVSPVLKGQDGIDEMCKVLKLIDDAGCTVTKKCGFHCHVGAANRPLAFWKSLLTLYGHYEPAIDTITAPSRRRSVNDYCRSTASQLKMEQRKAAIEAATTVPMLAHAYQGQIGRTEVGQGYNNTLHRFYKLNMAAFWRHQTVEFRQHQGTVNADKAKQWVILCLRMVAAAEIGLAPNGEPVTLQSFASMLSLPAADLAFWQQRAVELTRVINAERR